MGNTLRIVGACVVASALLVSGSAVALYENDIHISTDRDNISEDVNARAYNEIRAFMNQGYPIQSIVLHGVALGYSIDDIVFMSVRAAPDNAERIVDVAIDMLPTLPTWSCRDDSLGAENRFAPIVTVDEFGEVNSISTIAGRFFNENLRIAPLPDWTDNHVHLRVPTTELVELLGDDFWYRNESAGRPVNVGVLVSLYRHEQQIVVDGNLGQVRDAVERGDPSVPVVLLYNDEMYRPVSDFGEGPTLADVVSAYLAEEVKATHVPDWRGPYSDFHHVADIAEFEEFTTLPAREEIEDGRWNKIVAEIETDGFRRKPVIVSMYHEGSRVWIDQPDRLTAARSLGIETVPVVYLYHSIDRLACGVAPGSDCEERIRTAAELASLRNATAASQ